MGQIFDSFWRATAYCLHPRVIALSFLPLVLMATLSLGLGYFFWEPAKLWVTEWLDASALLNTMLAWLQGLGLGNLKAALAPLVVIFAVTPLIVLLSLLVVAAMMTPALISLVSDRRFPSLEKKRGGSLIVSVFWSLGSTLLALVALIISMPLWLVPPLILILPPLIWGWLTYRVMAFDALADHASADERRTLLQRHRGALLAMGIVTGYLGAAPSILWASGALVAAAFVILVPVAIWIYTLVFAFSSLWFTHFCLAALEKLRIETAAAEAPPAVPMAPYKPTAPAGPPELHERIDPLPHVEVLPPAEPPPPNPPPHG